MAACHYDTYFSTRFSVDGQDMHDKCVILVVQRKSLYFLDLARTSVAVFTDSGQVVLLEFAIQGPFTDVQHFGNLGAVAVVLMQQ